jgi:BirA family biotin operon repressor/biotin-[acetyl-CoA-carboxylase] ligase
VLVQADALTRSATSALSALREALPIIVVSREQTAGRGRLGRAWTSPSGGVYLSVLLEVVQPVEGKRQWLANDLSTSTLSLAALSPLTALAVHGALQNFSSRPLSIKWPNDLISGEGKLVGILVEMKRGNTVFGSARGDFANTTLVVIGVGINVNRPSKGAFTGASYLDDGVMHRLDLEAVAAAAIDSILAYHEDWLDGGCSFAPFVTEYRQHMALLGELVSVRSATGAVMAGGTVEGVDEDGRLLVATMQGVVTVTAGEVTLRNSGE